MYIRLINTINLVLVLNCVIIVAKKESENAVETSENQNNILDAKLNQSIYTEGGSALSEESKRRRIVGRKGVLETDNSTITSDPAKLPNATNEVAQNFTNTNAPITVHNNQSSNSLNLASDKSKESENKTSTIAIPANFNHTTSSAKLFNTSTISTTSTTTESTTKTTTTAAAVIQIKTTKKYRKPSITYSADDNPNILELEKNINYNVANEKSDEIGNSVPKVETDIDRAMLEEKRARKSYMIYLLLVFALPLALYMISIGYKRVKNYLELRHYQRVDFLVDGMYVS